MHRLVGAASLVFALLSFASAAADGKQQFTKCMACHSLEKGVHGVGPSLAKLSGRMAGSMAGFTYSTAMTQSQIVWNKATLSAFLENPARYVPGTAMPFAGLGNLEQRQALIDFLLPN